MSGRWHGGKGSIPRKRNQQKWSEGYDRIWGKKESDSEKTPTDSRSEGFAKDIETTVRVEEIRKEVEEFFETEVRK